MSRGSIVAADVWLSVMPRCGHRCHCRTCPKHKRQERGRCEATTDSARLIAGPVSPGPDPAHTMSRVPAGELVAWCPPCWDRAVAAARRHERQTGSDADGHGALF